MSTRSTIGIKRKDGTMQKIYCHWDGYIEGNGVILQLAYNTPEKIEELLKLGNLSSLGYYISPTSGEHSFGNPQRDVCVAYHRDRGEELEYINNSQMEEYNYIFDEWSMCWYVTYGVYHEWDARCKENPTATDGMKLLSMDCMFTSEEKLLIDAIIKLVDTSYWRDNEFANKDNLIDKCIEAAHYGKCGMEASAEDIKKWAGLSPLH